MGKGSFSPPTEPIDHLILRSQQMDHVILESSRCVLTTPNAEPSFKYCVHHISIPNKINTVHFYLEAASLYKLTNGRSTARVYFRGVPGGAFAPSWD